MHVCISFLIITLYLLCLYFSGVAKLLLDYGAGINTHSNEFKESALTLACYKGSYTQLLCIMYHIVRIMYISYVFMYVCMYVVYMY